MRKGMWKAAQWEYFIREMIKRYFMDEVGRSGAALAYYFVFSLFPFLLFLSSLFAFLQISPLDFIPELSRIIPEEVIQIVNVLLEHVKELRSGNILVFGLFFTFYFPMRAVNSLMLYISNAYRIRERRSKIRHMVIVFIFTIFLAIATLSSIVLISVGESVLLFISRIFHISSLFIRVWNYIRFALLAGMLFLVLSLLYYVTPGYRVKVKYIFPGALAAVALWLVISAGFAFYVNNMARYSVIYGSIGAIIVLLIWLYLSAVSMILGAEMNHVLMMMNKHRVARL